MKLYIGSALPPFHPQHYEMFPDLDDFIWVDNYVDHPDIKAWDAQELPVEDSSVEVIYNSHLLEHIAHPKVLDVLKHWHSKLQPGGQLVINVPDLAWIAKQITKIDQGYLLSGYYNTFDGNNGLISCIYGTHSHEGEIHKSGFIESSLRQLLQTAGFSAVQIERKFEAHEMGCLIAKAIK